MRLTEFTCQNYLTHRSLNIVVDDGARVLFVAGPNGSGKTGIAQGIRLALEGEPVRGLTYKNQLPDLITQGEDNGFVLVGAVADGAPGTWRTSLKSGAHEGGALDGSTLPLDPGAFLALAPVERRKTLFDMMGLRLKPEAVAEQLVAKGHDPKRVQAITHHFRLGFDAAAKQARELATEARGAWKATTGETHGEQKGGTWEAKVIIATDLPPLDKAKEAFDAAGNAAKAAIASREALKQDAAAWKRAESATRAKGALKDNLLALANLREQYAPAKRELDELERSAMHSGGQTAPCPACGVVLFWNTKSELREWEKAKPSTHPVQAHSQLKEKREALADLDARIKSVEQAVADGNAAQKLLAELPQQPSEDALRKAESDAGRANAALALAQSDYQRAQGAQDAKAAAVEKTAQAKAYHGDVLGYAALAEAVQHLPAEYLSATLGKLNDEMGFSATAFGMPVTVGDDMVPRYGSIPYPLASESQQWRIRAAVGYALAVLGKLGVVVLDQFDVIEPAARGAILKWLAGQTKVQVVLAATLKERPKLPPVFQVVWLGAVPQP